MTMMILAFSSILLLIMPCSMQAYTIKPDGGNSIGENVQVYKDAVENSIKLSTTTLTPPSQSILAPHQEHEIPTADPGPPNYWFHTKIHTFGNTGLFGALHAACAPIATALIDALAYKGENIRNTISKDLVKDVVANKKKHNSNYDEDEPVRAIDLCCGVGISTRALHNAFTQSSQSVDLIGIDTSPEMIAMANLLSNHNGYPTTSALSQSHHSPSTTCMMTTTNSKLTNNKNQKKKASLQYVMTNAENTVQESGTFDLVTIMYGFHEIPYNGRQRILNEAKRLLRDGGTLAVIDICPTYSPSPSMLAGEPYVLEYQTNIVKQLATVEGFDDDIRFDNAVPGHVCLWQLTKTQ